MAAPLHPRKIPTIGACPERGPAQRGRLQREEMHVLEGGGSRVESLPSAVLPPPRAGASSASPTRPKPLLVESAYSGAPANVTPPTPSSSTSSRPPCRDGGARSLSGRAGARDHPPPSEIFSAAEGGLPSPPQRQQRQRVHPRLARRWSHDDASVQAHRGALLPRGSRTLVLEGACPATPRRNSLTGATTAAAAAAAATTTASCHPQTSTRRIHPSASIHDEVSVYNPYASPYPRRGSSERRLVGGEGSFEDAVTFRPPSLQLNSTGSAEDAAAELEYMELRMMGGSGGGAGGAACTPCGSSSGAATRRRARSLTQRSSGAKSCSGSRRHGRTLFLAARGRPAVLHDPASSGDGGGGGGGDGGGACPSDPATTAAPPHSRPRSYKWSTSCYLCMGEAAMEGGGEGVAVTAASTSTSAAAAAASWATSTTTPAGSPWPAGGLPSRSNATSHTPLLSPTRDLRDQDGLWMYPPADPRRASRQLGTESDGAASQAPASTPCPNDTFYFVVPPPTPAVPSPWHSDSCLQPLSHALAHGFPSNPAAPLPAALPSPGEAPPPPPPLMVGLCEYHYGVINGSMRALYGGSGGATPAGSPTSHPRPPATTLLAPLDAAAFGPPTPIRTHPAVAAALHNKVNPRTGAGSGGGEGQSDDFAAAVESIKAAATNAALAIFSQDLSRRLAAIKASLLGGGGGGGGVGNASGEGSGSSGVKAPAGSAGASQAPTL